MTTVDRSQPDDDRPEGDDEVEEAEEESFPASDPPSQWAGAR